MNRDTRRLPLVAASAAVGLVGTLAAHLMGGGGRITVRSVPTTSLPSSTPTTSPSGSTPVAGGTPNRNGSSVGALEQYGYGELSVKVTVRNGKIVGLDVTNLQTAESYSQQIAVQVIPMLKSEVLSAQSAQISAISGATYTSEAYAASVQSALDKLHA